MEFNSLSKLFLTTSGKGSPYIECTFFIVIFLISSSAPSILGGNVSSGIGLITSQLSAIKLGFVITTSLATSSPKYENSFNISSVVFKYNGG